MELAVSLVDAARSGAPVDVVITAAPGAPLGAVRGALAAELGGDPGRPLLLGSGAPLEDDAPLGSPPLVRGAVLVLAARGRGDVARGDVGRGDVGRDGRSPTARGDDWPRPVALLALHVVAGPGAGTVVPLEPGRHVVGRGSRCSLRLEDARVSREHVELDVVPGGTRLRDLGSANGTRVDGRSVAGEWVPAVLGALLEVGPSTLVLRSPGGTRAPTTPTGRGSVAVHRPPRARPPLPTAAVEVRLPVEPAVPPPARLPLLGVLLPVLVAVPMALLWSPLALLLALSAPVMALGTFLGDRRSAGGVRRRGARAHAERSEAARAEAARLLEEEAAALQDLHPDAATVLVTADRALAALWGRRGEDDDALLLRVGTGRVASGVDLVTADGSATPDAAEVVHGAGDPDRAGPGRLEHPRAPALVDLARPGVTGLAGPRSSCAGLLRTVVGRAAVQLSPVDLGVVVLRDTVGGALGGGAHDDAVADGEWSWVRWLPHGLGSGDGGVLAEGSEAVRAVAGQLAERARARTARTGAAPPTGAPGRVLVVLDGARRLRAHPEVAQLLAGGGAAGLVLLCWEGEVEGLPLECRSLLVLDGAGRLSALGCGDGAPPRAGGMVGPVDADLVGRSWAEQVARALAPLEDATPAALESALPVAVRLVDLLAGAGVDATDPGAVRRAWESAGRSTRVPLGRTARGTWWVDLLREGPHLLVAGTTGAGKSELLSALVLALAVVNRPDELAVVLVDYKGGAAFADLAGLPHAVGLVTDLDEHLARRALASLGAEVRRRERLLRDAGCRDLRDWQERGAHHPGGGEPLPRLVVVVDEFRVLADELPELVDGLVRLAAVGRSLGIHLVLATQRPAGAVSADIRANTNLRVALRVRDDVDSTDVVDSPDAARIGADLPGRAVVRAGGGPLVHVQVARVGGGPGPDGAARALVRRWHDAAAASPPAPGTTDASGDVPRATDAQRVVAALRAAARDVPAAASPWLPPLPDVVRLPSAPTSAPTSAPGSAPGSEDGLPLVYGLLDDPEGQAHHALGWSGTEPLVVVGGPRSGRTTTLRSLAAAILHRDPSTHHLHVVDGRDGGLAPVRAAPHVGGVVAPGDGEHLLRLLHHLLALVATAHRRGPAPPVAAARTVLVVDDVDRLVAEAASGSDRDAELAVELLGRLLAEGPAAGVVAVLAGDRSLLTGRLASPVAQRLVLALADPTDYALAGVPSRHLPARMPPGRGLLLGHHPPREVQVGVLGEDTSGAAQREELADLAERARVRWPSVAAPPEHLPPLPRRLTATELDTHVARSPHRAPGVVVGLGGQRASPLLLDLAATPRVLVAGDVGSGRSSLLLALAQRLHGSGSAVLVVGGRGGPLVTWARAHGLVTHDGGPGAGAHGAATALRDDLAACPRAVTVLVDDADQLEPVVDEVLAEHLQRAPALVSGTLGQQDVAPRLVLAGTSGDLTTRYSGVVPLVRRARAGLLLHPLSPVDGELLGVRLPRGGPGPPGRATVVHRGRCDVVQLALPA